MSDSPPSPPTTEGQRVAKHCRRHSWMVDGYLLCNDKPTHERRRCRRCPETKVVKLKERR